MNSEKFLLLLTTSATVFIATLTIGLNNEQRRIREDIDYMKNQSWQNISINKDSNVTGQVYIGHPVYVLNEHERKKFAENFDRVKNDTDENTVYFEAIE